MATALLCRDNGITLPWRWHYSAVAMALLCRGDGCPLQGQQQQMLND